MKKFMLVGVAILFYAFFSEASIWAQTQPRSQTEDRKFEVGLHFTSLTFDGGSRTEPGLGTRLTYNATEHFAFEMEGDLWPRNASFSGSPNGGRSAAMFAGAKIGKRFDRWGIFAKARPGLITFSQGRLDIVPNGSNNVFPFDLRAERRTHFALDLGGVLELYPTKRVVTRFDAGDTIIRYGATTLDVFEQSPAGAPIVVPFAVPAQTTHNFQFSAGIGFRF